MKLPILVALLAACVAPYTPPAAAQPSVGPTATIDYLLRAAWHANKVIPAPPVDDAHFLRRAYLDILGVIPTPEAVKAFLADKTPGKRAALVDTLLSDSRYADHWTSYWDNVLIGRQARSQVLDRVSFREWLHGQFQQNRSYDQFVRDLITARGINSPGGSYARVAGLATRMDQTAPAMARATDPPLQGGYAPAVAPVNGAVNWMLKYAGNPQDLAGSASRIFLGVQIQCAQCHDHKSEKWKQEDFRRFTACFVAARPRPVDVGKVMGIRRVDLEDTRRPFAGRPKVAANNQQYVTAAPAALDGTDFSDSPNRREALAEWMTAPNNPWFAEAIVNRMWAHFLGRGFVEPIDDFRPSNPPVVPDALKALAVDFRTHGYDLKRLIRTICGTQVYQLSAAPAKQADPDNLYWARFRLKPLGPDELLNSLVAATNIGPVLERVAGARLDQLRFAIYRQFEFLFDLDEEFEQRDFEGTIPQALLLLNGNLTNRSVMPIPGTALADVLAAPGDDAQKIESLYLRTLSRRPTLHEVHVWQAFLTERSEVIVDPAAPRPQPGGNRALSPGARPFLKRGGADPDPLGRPASRLTDAVVSPKEQAYEDLFWALLNSSEFTFNH